MNIEYLYLALKSMFEEIRTLVGLEIKDNILHRQLDTLMNKIDHGASADHVQGSARNPQLANFKTYVLKF